MCKNYMYVSLCKKTCNNFANFELPSTNYCHSLPTAIPIPTLIFNSILKEWIDWDWTTAQGNCSASVWSVGV